MNQNPRTWSRPGAFQFDSLRMADAFWTGVETVGGVSPGYGRTGRLQPLADAGAVALARSRATQAEGDAFPNKKQSFIN